MPFRRLGEPWRGLGVGLGAPLSSPIKYDFRDDFTDIVTAGSVNGTAATPGVGSRVSVDTASKSSVSGGYYNFDKKAAPGYGDPCLWENYAVTRVAGKQFVFHVIFTTMGSTLIGLDADTAGTLPTQGALFFQAAQLTVWDVGTSPSKLGAGLSVGYDYYITLIARTLGFHYLIKGGPEYPEQTLLYSSKPPAGTGATLYPMIDNNSSVGKSSYVRVVSGLWMPSPIVSDSFFRANGPLGITNGLGHQEATGLGAGGAGYAWTDRVGTYAINTNKAQASALDGGVAISTVTTGETDINVQLRIVSYNAGVSGVVLRYVDADNYIYAGFDGTNWKAVKRVGGVETTVLTDAQTIGNGEIRVMLHGTNIYFVRNQNGVQSGATIADAVLQTSTLHGLYTTDITNPQQEFSVWSRT